ncbi:MAG TPA: PhoH family protein [Planctomycetota bacterium]|nr:PhoH family protein [Planctomycetota bacterium]
MKFRHKIRLPDTVDLVQVFGPYDSYLKLIRNKLGVKIVMQASRGGSHEMVITGQKQPVETAFNALSKMLSSRAITEEMVMNLIGGNARTPDSECLGGAGLPERMFVRPSAPNDVFAVKARTEGQENYLKVLYENDIVIAIGPAGTGKTYLAVARALASFKKGEVRKIILCRPAVEAGERLGFLPGDYQEKVNPYLRPLYDALNGFLEYQQLKRLMETEIVEVVPLAYMRGRNLDNAFMILDEAQNTTSEQMKMFLTRMGQNSKIVVTGDITQIDLPLGKASGLIEAQSIIANIPGIAFCYLTRADIVRHRLVQSIVDAYEVKRNQKSKQK